MSMSIAIHILQLSMLATTTSISAMLSSKLCTLHIHCHDHDHNHGEIEDLAEKDCHAELQHHHSHCCHEPHDQDNKIAAESVQELSSISSLPERDSQAA